MVAASFSDMVSVSSISDLTILICDRFLVLSPLSVLAGAALLAPRLQLFTYLMCKDIDAGQWDPENRAPNPDILSMGPTRPIPCAADPIVQAKVAMFLTSLCHSVLQIYVLTKSGLVTETVQGILSCLTAIFWGSVRALITLPYCTHPEFFKFSDRYGRVKFLSLSIVTLLLGDAALAALAVAPEYVPGGYWFLLLTSALGGLFGGGFCPQNLTTSNDTLLSFRTFCGPCSCPCVSCGLQ